MAEQEKEELTRFYGSLGDRYLSIWGDSEYDKVPIKSTWLNKVIGYRSFQSASHLSLAKVTVITSSQTAVGESQWWQDPHISLQFMSEPAQSAGHLSLSLSAAKILLKDLREGIEKFEAELESKP